MWFRAHEFRCHKIVVMGHQACAHAMATVVMRNIAVHHTHFDHGCKGCSNHNSYQQIDDLHPASIPNQCICASTQRVPVAREFENRDRTVVSVQDQCPRRGTHLAPQQELSEALKTDLKTSDRGCGASGASGQGGASGLCDGLRRNHLEMR